MFYCEMLSLSFYFIFVFSFIITMESAKFIPTVDISTAKQFFLLEQPVKERFIRVSAEDRNWGYVPFKMETFEKSRSFDLKECLNFQLKTNREKDINKTLPNFMNSQRELFHSCRKLTMLLLNLLSLSLGTTLRFLPSQHRFIGDDLSNPTTLRLPYYPPIDNLGDIAENKLRCGEHADYGTITLLFQDQAGGLQV